MEEKESVEQKRYVEVGLEELPLHCPTPAVKLWSSHPRVFLPIHEKGEALCPYCGTLYRLKGGTCPPHH